MLVSCAMLTCNRRHLLSVALKCYLDQDYRERELIVVDDGDECVADMFAGVTNACYHRAEKFKTVGDKLNFACEQSHGDVIVTWDDDDWYASNRITDQVARLEETGKQVTGYHTILFWDGARASRYSNPPSYMTGTSQVYSRDFWKSNPFEAKNVGYDNDLTRSAHKVSIASDGGQMVVARIHGQNVSGRRDAVGSPMWPYVPASEIPAAFFEAIR